ncbi:TIGR03086 family metal-binding protein [Kibdelosporangium persicum]|uniref:Mycothiol maleylpyruvate isomerase N-terminal domain n=1 Tax=Kibdelosporangium persicum TaxID=2698649 RepID=A0ABX2FGG5_9PSEU|nr:TIGR03086 family metal-binding protein [Kibdelosporangium persicum]NRN70496.1 Mycothiol maleylpyruvate isomerase N-terminal domain [Kibdelosporangium persicum]
MDFRELDRQAMKLTSEVIGQVRPDQLRLPTPCADWTLHGLLRHLVSEDLGFAAATTAGTGLSDVDWNAGGLGPDPVAGYRRAAAGYVAAFEPGSVLDRPMRIGVFGVVPGSVAVTMHFIDTVVHGWDVARTIGVPYTPDERIAAAALKAMRRFPSDRPTAAFDVQVTVPDDTSELDKLVAYAGRDPHWT